MLWDEFQILEGFEFQTLLFKSTSDVINNCQLKQIMSIKLFLFKKLSVFPLPQLTEFKGFCCDELNASLKN